jgi:hypothetical protein
MADNDAPGALPPPIAPESNEMHLDWYTMVLELIDVADVQLLVESAPLRNVPATLIQVMKNLVTTLMMMQSKVAAGAGRQFGGAGNTQQDKNLKKAIRQIEKEGREKSLVKAIDKVVKDKGGGKEKEGKEKTDLTKMKEWCDLLSVVYSGSNNVTDSYNKLTHAIPWYEHCLYVFRRERFISRQVKVWGIHAKIPREIIVQLDEVMTVFGKIKQHLAMLYKERYAMATKVNFSSLGASNAPRSFTMTAVPGFFIVSAPTTTFVKVDKANEGVITSAFMNRTLEYGARISLDRFLILYNSYFSTILMDSIGDYEGMGVGAYISEDSGNVRFTQLTYTVSTDTFVISKTPVFEIGFRISAEGSGYPQPVIVFVHTSRQRFQGGYPHQPVGGSDPPRDDASVPVNIFEETATNPVDTAEMIASWVQTDGKQIMLNHSFIGNRAL